MINPMINMCNMKIVVNIIVMRTILIFGLGWVGLGWDESQGKSQSMSQGQSQGQSQGSGHRINFT